MVHTGLEARPSLQLHTASPNTSNQDGVWWESWKFFKSHENYVKTLA